MLRNKTNPSRIAPARLDLALAATLALCIVRLWLMPLPSSFWVDEMGTAFVVRHGASEPSLRAAPQVADSVYYFLPKIAVKLAGSGEVAFRFFSVLAMAGTLLAVAAIAARLFDRRAAWFAVFACLAFKSLNYEAADARPYALGSFVLALAILLLIRWLDSGRVRDGLFFAAAASLLWWVQLIFWPFYIVFALYAGFRLLARQAKPGWGQTLAVFAAIGVAVAPVALRALALLHQAGAHVITEPPRSRDLGVELNLSLLTGTCTLAVLLSRWLRWDAPGSSPPRAPAAAASVLLIGAWWLIDPLAIFAFSRITGNSVFVARYMYPALPGAALMLVLLVALSAPPAQWRRLALVLGVGVLVFTGHWGHLWPPHQNSDWRGGAAAVRAFARGEDVPVICPSPFIEARPPVWTPAYPVSGFLYSNLAYYPMGGHIYPFPFESSPEAEAWAAKLSAGTLARAPRFALYGSDKSVKFWRAWFARRPELNGWTDQVRGFGDVWLDEFTPPAAR